MNNDIEHKQYVEHNKLEIDIGANLQIQVGLLADRMDSSLIGICPGKYLIIGMPRGSEQVMAPLHEEGTSLIIRYIHHGNVYGFRSALLHALARPERLLFISYPAQVQVYELRNYPRVACFLPARAAIDHQLFDGSVINVSRTGARFAFPVDEATVALVGRIDTELELDIQFPGAAGYTHIAGNLRDIHASSDKVNLGVRFDRIEGPQLANLLSFLLDAQALPEHHGLSAVIRKHAIWKKSVSAYFHAVNDAKPAFAMAAENCDMGKWLNGVGKDQYGNTAEFQQLEQTHHRLHEEVTAATKLRQSGEKEGALGLFNKLDIGHLSHRISALLIAADEHRTDVAAVAVGLEEPHEMTPPPDIAGLHGTEAEETGDRVS